MIAQELPANLKDSVLRGSISTEKLNSSLKTQSLGSNITTPAIKSNLNIPERLRGEDGKDAYELAVEAGYLGSMEEWLQSLAGPPGPDGEQGLQGDTGTGIATFEKVKETDSADTYQFVLTDGTTFSFDIPHGKDAVADHSTLDNREAKNQHPIEAISGLDEFSNMDILNLWNTIMGE